MATILTRIKQKIFGVTGDPSQFGKIGSEATGTPVNTKDLDLIQSLSQFDSGLYAITGNGNELPRIEDINALYLLITSQLAYLMQAGIPEYSATTDYFADISIVQYLGNTYVSKTGTSGTPNTGNTPSTSTANWRPIGGRLRITSPANESTLTILDGKTVTVNKTLTLDARADGASVVVPASGNLLASSGALSFATLSNPTGTSSTTGVMMGLAGLIAPVNSTRVVATFTGQILSTVSGDDCFAVLRYGTGTPPSNGTAPSGTALTPGVGLFVAVANSHFPITLTAAVTGLTLGTAYWFDLQLTNNSGTGTALLAQINFLAYEV